MIDSKVWDSTLRRRQQYYGIKYFQTSHEVPSLQPSDSTPVHPLEPFRFLIERLIQLGYFERRDPPNQCLVNEYLRTVRLSNHIEDTEAFGEVICGVSIGGPEWLRLDRDGQEVRIFLEDRSLYVLQGEARTHWRHGIGRNWLEPIVKD